MKACKKWLCALGLLISLATEAQEQAYYPDPDPAIRQRLVLLSNFVDYKWQTGNAADTLQNLTVKASGSFSVIVVNPQGCSDTSASVNATFNALPAVPVISGDLEFCLGETVQLSSTSSAGYLWTPNGETTQNISVSSSGTFSVKVTDSNGCSNTSAPVNTIATAPPVAGAITFSGTLNRCLGDSIILTANPAGLDYKWQTGNAADTLQNLTIKASGSFSVIVSNSHVCTDTSASVNATFNA